MCAVRPAASILACRTRKPCASGVASEGWLRRRPEECAWLARPSSTVRQRRHEREQLRTRRACFQVRASRTDTTGSSPDARSSGVQPPLRTSGNPYAPPSTHMPHQLIAVALVAGGLHGCPGARRRADDPPTSNVTLDMEAGLPPVRLPARSEGVQPVLGQQLESDQSLSTGLIDTATKDLPTAATRTASANTASPTSRSIEAPQESAAPPPARRSPLWRFSRSSNARSTYPERTSHALSPNCSVVSPPIGSTT
jgi:hypothetical protein